MGFLPLLPSCGKSGKRMNYEIFCTFHILMKWDVGIVPCPKPSGQNRDK